MNLQPQSNFINALKEIMKDDIAAIAFNTEELFFLANDLCAPDQRIRFGTYLRFLDSLNEYGEPAQVSKLSILLMEVHDYLKAQEVKQKMKMLQAIKEGKKDWRRFVWLLQFRQKEERLLLAQAKQLEREQKEKQKAAEAAAKIETTTAAPAPTLTTATAQPMPHAAAAPAAQPAHNAPPATPLSKVG